MSELNVPKYLTKEVFLVLAKEAPNFLAALCYEKNGEGILYTCSDCNKSYPSGRVHSCSALGKPRKRRTHRKRPDGAKWGSMQFATGLAILMCHAAGMREFTGVEVRRKMEWLFVNFRSQFGDRVGRRVALHHTVYKLRDEGMIEAIREGHDMLVAVKPKSWAKLNTQVALLGDKMTRNPAMTSKIIVEALASAKGGKTGG